MTARGVADSVVGGAALILFGKLCQYVRARLLSMRSTPPHHPRWEDDNSGRPASLEEAFAEMAVDSEKLAHFLGENGPTRIGEMADKTGVERERLYPLLKLAGMEHVVRGPNRWCWREPSPQRLPLGGSRED